MFCNFIYSPVIRVELNVLIVLLKIARQAGSNVAEETGMCLWSRNSRQEGFDPRCVRVRDISLWVSSEAGR